MHGFMGIYFWFVIMVKSPGKDLPNISMAHLLGLPGVFVLDARWSHSSRFNMKYLKPILLRRFVPSYSLPRTALVIIA